MLRAYCADWSPENKDAPDLSKEEIHHLVKVRRIRNGEAVDILNGRGAIAHCVAVMDGSHRLRLERKRISQFPTCRPTVQICVAPPKGKGFAQMLPKLVELGVNRISPLVTDHGEVDAERVEVRRERWQAILIEAIKQSGNPWLPDLEDPQPVAAVLENMATAHKLCAALQSDAVPFWQLVSAFQPEHTNSIAAFIGPEGDFSPAEYGLLRSAGCAFASLGPLVLKVETAVTTVCSCLRMRLLLH